MFNKLISLALLIFFLTGSYSYSENEFIFPKKKPSVFKKIQPNITSKNLNELPKKKPIIQLESQDNDNFNKEKNEKKVIKNLKKIPLIEKETKHIKKNIFFLLPQKKPITYKVQSNEIKKSTILSQKDFEKAKETIKFIKARKWNSALKSAKKVKDSEFRTLVTWMHLKTTQNSATFNDYKNFIEQHEKYPRIDRIKYLAETKIYLRNHSPTSIINWFERHPPLGGIGKIKLAEAFLEQGKVEEVKKLIKEGWVTAEISKNDLGYYRAKFKKFLNIDDHLKRKRLRIIKLRL